MMLKTKIQLLLIGIVVISIYGCIKTQNVPNTPSISFKDFIKYGKDSADMIITFQDGDGDIGHLEGDTAPPFNVNGKYYYDMLMLYYYKGADNKFHRFKIPPPGDSMLIGYHIPYVTPKGQNRYLNGEISARILAPYYVLGEVPPHTVIRFEIFIYDRALNKSNVVVTPEITVP